MRRRLAGELAGYRGRDLHAATEPRASGLRVVVRRYSALDDEARAEAQAFVAGGKAVLIASCDGPPSLLVAASQDSGVHAGNSLKPKLQAAGGRGGGSAAVAQGSVPDTAALETVVRHLEDEFSAAERH